MTAEAEHQLLETTLDELKHLFSPRAAEGETRSDLAPLPRWLNSALALIARADFAVCRALPVPFGTSVFTVARTRMS